MRTSNDQISYIPPQVTDLGNHASFVQATQLSILSDGVILDLGGGMMVIGTVSP